MAEIVADLEGAIERAVRAGCRREDLLVDPGFGFGKTPEHNLTLLRELASLRVLERPILLGTSRKSTLGRVLDLPADERLEATLATTALGIASGVDVVRVHDVRANVRVARMTDAIVRMTDRIVLHDMVFMGRHGVLEHEQREAQPFHVDVELELDLQPAGIDDDLTRSVDYGIVFETCRRSSSRRASG